MKPYQFEQWGNQTTMNLNNLIYSNIKLSVYYKSLSEISEFHEAIDEIYNEVEYLEPFATGSVVSSAFCLLFKLFNMKINAKQIRTMVDHRDSPYIRALGFLYLRYVCKPDYLWSWFENYLDDEEELNLTKGPLHKKTTIGKLCRMLLEDMKFCGTMLPRIPVPIARQIETSMSSLNKSNNSKDLSRSPSPSRSRRSPSYRRYARSPSRDEYRRKSPRRDNDRRDYGRNRRDGRDRRDDRDHYHRRSYRSRSPRREEERPKDRGFKETRTLRRYD